MNTMPPITQQPVQPNAQMMLAQIDQRLAYLTQIVDEMAAQQQEVQRVNVVDANMSFGSMVVFMVKWAIASIPAAIILFTLGMIVMIVFVLLGGFFAALL